MRIRRCPVEDFLAFILAAVLLFGCASDRRPDDYVERCWAQGFDWRDGECRDRNGKAVDPT